MPRRKQVYKGLPLIQSHRRAAITLSALALITVILTVIAGCESSQQSAPSSPPPKPSAPPYPPPQVKLPFTGLNAPTIPPLAS